LRLISVRSAVRVVWRSVAISRNWSLKSYSMETEDQCLLIQVLRLKGDCNLFGLDNTMPNGTSQSTSVRCRSHDQRPYGAVAPPYDNNADWTHTFNFSRRDSSRRQLSASCTLQPPHSSTRRGQSRRGNRSPQDRNRCGARLVRARQTGWETWPGDFERPPRHRPRCVRRPPQPRSLRRRKPPDIEITSVSALLLSQPTFYPEAL
jgi:hypothetical protein